MNCRICLGQLTGAEIQLKMHKRCMRRLFNTTSIRPELSFSRSDMTGEMLARNTRRMSISGVQQKLSIKIQNGELQPTDTGGEYILKPSPPEYPHAAENEHLSMLLGELCGIDSAQCGLIEFADGELAYITRRYDRMPDGARIHQEDMAQALGRVRDKTGEYKYDASYEEAGRMLRKATGGKLAPVYEFFRRLIVRFLIRDGDYHLKNISLWKPDAQGVYAGLAPNYDMLNTGMYLPSETTFALDLLAKGEFTRNYEQVGFYTWTDFLELADRIRLTRQAAGRGRREILGRLDKIRTLIQCSFLAGPMKKDYIDGLDERVKCLQSE